MEGWRSIIKYLCLAYQNEQELSSLSKCEYDALIAETIAYLDELRRTGHYVSSNALEFVETATSIRVREGRLFLTEGPFVETKEQVGGYILIEARDLNDAIRIASRFPPVRMGGIEVRPVKDHEAEARKREQSNGVETATDLPDGLSNPARRALATAGYVRLEQLNGVSEDEIAQLHGIGPKGINALRDALAERGMAFAGEPGEGR